MTAQGRLPADHHYALTQSQRTLSDYIAAFEAGGYKYHLIHGPGGVNTYAVTPNGIAIQLAGLPVGEFNDTASVGSAAGDLCTQSCVPVGPDAQG